MTGPVRFHFDLASPWSYLAFHNLDAVLERTGAHAILVPVLVGAVFKAANPELIAARDGQGARFRHALLSLHRWAALSGLPLDFPTVHHPARSVTAMRMASALADDQPALRAFATAAFAAYMARGENLDDPAVLVAAAKGAGLDGQAILERASTQGVKDRLRADTDALIAAGGFGVPTMIVGDSLFFGNDELPLIEAALRTSAA